MTRDVRPYTEGTKSLAKEAIVELKSRLLGDGVRFSQRLPMKRYGQPDEVARMVLVMASDLSAYMCGAEVVVDGGFLSS